MPAHAPSPAAAVVNAQALIDDHPMSPFQYTVLFLCFTVLALDGFDTAAIGYVAPALVAKWGVTRAALAPVMSAALFGLAFGAMAAGPASDRYGRKPVILASTLVFGVFSALTATAESVQGMAVLRFITGLGLGAAMPNAVTLMAELAPARRRSFIVNAVYVGFPLGAALGGFISAALIPQYGWSSVFVLGGALPLLLLPLMAWLLPESVAYMLVRGHSVAKVAAVLRRICGRDLSDVAQFTAGEPVKAPSSKGALAQILSGRYRLVSLMLWTTYFMGLLIYYLLTSWMPLMMKDAGFTIQKAALLSALFPLGGGIGTLAGGWLMDRVSPARLLAAIYLAAAVLLIAVGQSLGNVGETAFAVLVFSAGIMVTGAQASLPALAAPLYPTHSRATGIASMLAVGRFGGILGAMVGGVLLGLQLSFSVILALLAIPALIAMTALVALAGRTAK